MSIQGIYYYFDVLEILDTSAKGIRLRLLDDDGTERDLWLARKKVKILSVRDRKTGAWKKVASVPEWLAIKAGLIMPDFILKRA